MRKRGRLRHRVDIEQRSSVQDSGGQPLLQWTSFERRVPAQIRPLKGNEIFTAQQYAASINSAIEMDYRPGLREDMRIVFEGVNYNIKVILDDEMRHVNLTLMCESGVSANG